MPVHPLLAERARRITALRQRLVAAVLATFVLAWGAVVWDGSMGATTTAQVTTTTTEQTTTEESATTDDSSSAETEKSTDSLTTGQS